MKVSENEAWTVLIRSNWKWQDFPFSKITIEFSVYIQKWCLSRSLKSSRSIMLKCDFRSNWSKNRFSSKNWFLIKISIFSKFYQKSHFASGKLFLNSCLPDAIWILRQSVDAKVAINWSIAARSGSNWENPTKLSAPVWSTVRVDQAPHAIPINGIGPQLIFSRLFKSKSVDSYFLFSWPRAPLPPIMGVLKRNGR